MRDTPGSKMLVGVENAVLGCDETQHRAGTTAPLGLCSLPQQGQEHPGDWCTYAPWGPVHPGDLNTSRTRAPWGLVHPEASPKSSSPSFPRHGQLTGWQRDTVPGDVPGMWAAHTLAAALSCQAFRTAPLLALTNYCQRARKAALPLLHATNCCDAATRKYGGCLPVPGARTGLQRLQSQRIRARHQPGQALCSPVRGGQKHS